MDINAKSQHKEQNMFDAMIQERREQEARVKYSRDLGWKEYDEDGDQVHAVIYVLDMNWGYGVIRHGSNSRMVFHSKKLHEAVEWAVDEVRKEVSTHEMHQVKRDIHLPAPKSQQSDGESAK